jgi:hypothetical protein
MMDISPPFNAIKNEGMRPDGGIDPTISPIRMWAAEPKRKSLEITEDMWVKVGRN